MKKLNNLIVHCASSIVHQSKTLTLLLVMLMSVNVWGANATYTKVTSTPTDWSGTYILVYENNTTANICTAGVDDASNYATGTISNSTITGDYADYEVEVATYSTGYSIKALGGTNKGKFLEGKGSSTNGTAFATSASKVTTFSLSSGVVTITNNTNVFAYNSANNNLRWRFFKSSTASGSGYYKPCLYKKEAAATTAYTVTYDGNGHGTPAKVSEKEASAGAGVTLPTCTANDGWKFLGWATTSGATTADAGNAGAAYKPSKDITLFAVYKQLFKVTLVRNNSSETTGWQEDSYTLPTDEVAACDGWDFKGWTTESSVDGTTAPDFVTAATATGTYYAVYGQTVDGGSKTYSFTISTSDFSSEGYKSTSFTSTAKASDASTQQVTWSATEFGSVSGKLQAKKGTSNGVTNTTIANANIVINGNGGGQFKSSSTASGFTIKNSSTSSAATATSFTITYTVGSSTTTYKTNPPCSAVTPFTITLKRFGQADEVRADITQAFTLPTTGETGPCNDWRFIGWTANSTYTDGATSPVLVTNSGTETATYYAVYMQDALAIGDQVVIYNPDKNVALGTTTNGSKLNGIAPTISQDKSQITALGSNTAVLTVGYSGSDMYFVNGSKYLTCPASGSGMSFASSVDNYSYWSYDPTTRYIKNKNAAYNSNPQYFEYYSGYTTYSLGGGGNAFIFDFYKKDGSVYNKVEWGGVTYSIQPKCKTQTVVTPDNTKSITVGGTTLDVASLFTITSGYDGTATYAIKSGSDCAGLNGTTLTATKEGSVVITCTAPETDNYKPASADATVTVKCGNVITIIKGYNPTGGTFTINGQATNLTDVCADGGYTVTVAATPSPHYTLTSVTSESGTVGAISGNSCIITDITANTTINVEFTEDAKFDVKLHIGSQIITKSGIYIGTKFSELTELPTPAGTDAGDCADTFIDWATQAIDGVDADGTNVKWEDGETVIDANKDFYAVFATASEGTQTTEELTNNEVTSLSASSALAYATEKTYKGTNLQYSIYGYTDNNSRPWIQQKKDKGAYIKVTAPEDIKQVELTITSAQNNKGGITEISEHIAYSGSVGLVTTDCAFTTESANVGITSTITNNKATITTTESTKEVMIKVTTGARIWGIKTTYGAGTTYSDYVTSCIIPTYSVTIQSNDNAMGSVTVDPKITEDAYEAGTEFTVMAEPTDEAVYRFIGWTITPDNTGATLDDATSPIVTFTTGAADVTLTANFEAIPADPITVTLNVGEHGTLDCKDCVNNTITEDNAGEGVLVPNVNANEGWAFLGWSTSSTATEPEYEKADIFYPSETNKTLYAIYAQLYKVTLKYTDEVLWQETAGGAITLPSRDCKNETYKDHFAGWSITEFAEETVNPATAPTIIPVGEYTPTEDIILYPVFSVTAETTQWKKVAASAISETGVYALLGDNNYPFNGKISGGKGQQTDNAFEFVNNIATSAPEGTCELTMTFNSGKCSMYNADNGYLYPKDNTTGNLAWATTVYDQWTYYSDQSTWEYKISSGKYAHLRSNNSQFNTYGSAGYGTLISFAKKETTSVGKYWSKPANDVVNPELDLAAGDYLAPQTIKITDDTYQSGYKYYYTTNGNNPDKTSAEYDHENGIKLETADNYTVKVIGYDEDGYTSQIAAAEYTIWATYSTLAEMYGGFQKDKLVGLSMTDAYIHKVNKTSGANPTTQLFLQEKDSKLGVVLSMPTANVPEGITSEIEGKSITFTVTGKYALGSGRKQIGSATIADGFTISEDKATRPTAEVKTVWDATLESTNLLGLIKLENVYVISENGTTIIVNTKADGQGTAYTIYDIFYAVGKVPESTLLCNVSGLFNVRDDAYSIMPVITEDFSLVTPTNSTLPTLNIYGGSQEEPVKVGLNEVINITPADGFTAYYKVNDAAEWTEITKQVESISLTVDTKLEVKSTRDYYTDATATYYYKIDASLTKYAITIPSLSKTRGTVTVTLDAEEVASAKAGETLTITVSDITEHFHINSVSVVKSDDDKQTAADVENISDGVYTFVMPECNVDIKVTYGEEKKYSITYQKGGIQAQGEDITEVAQYEGTVLTLKECTWTSDNYVFKGWKAQYNDGEKDVELPITNNTIAVPAYNVKIIATWNKIASYDWVLVTDASTLKAGDYVVIASNAKGKVAPKTITSGYMEPVEATFSDDYGYLKSVPTNAAVFTLGGEVGAWTLTDKDGRKLGAINKGKLAWDGQNATNTWTIAIDGTSHNATITNTAEGYGHFMHNVNNLNRLTTYTSGSSNIMLLPQLYKAVEHTYVVKYNLNGGANKPADSHADSDGKVTITTDVPTYTAHKFLGWNAEQDGSGQEYVGGQEYTIEDDITVYAQWQEVSKYTVTYIANGATGKVPTETEKYETAKFSVKGQGELEYPDYIFRGWSDGENTYQEGDEYTMPNHAVEFTAQWESLFDTHWALVVSLEQLQDGDKVIIAAANSDKALGAEYDNKYRQEVDVKKSTDKFYLSTLQTTPTELTLGIVNGKYTFNDGDGYLYAAGNATSKQNWLDIEEELEEGIWNITIENGVASITSTVNEVVPIMSYNSSATRFSCYTQIQGQGTLAIYKYYEDKPTYYTRENMTAGKIGTICMENNILATANATIYMPDYKDATIKNVYFVEATEELANPGMPFIFQAEQDGRIILVLGSETAVNPVSNLTQTRGMVGSFDDDVEVAPYVEDGPHNYFFNSNKLWKVGVGVYVDKNRAYMNMDYVPDQEDAVQDEPSAAPRRRLSMVNADADQGGVITGLGDVLKADKVQKLIINDKMYILRAGKMYDATGKFVK